MRFNIIFIVILFVFTSCRKEPSLSVTVSQNSFSATSAESSMAIVSNTSWKITGGDGWCIPTPSKGNGNAEVKLQISANTTKEARSTTLTVSAEDLIYTVTIDQQQDDAIIVSEKIRNLDNTAQSITVQMKTNIQYSVIIPSSVDWITEEAVKSFNTYTHVFRIAQNDSYDNRSAKIVFKDKSGTLSDTLTINQTQKNALILTSDRQTISYMGGAINVELKSNISYETIIPSAFGWITPIITRGLTTYNHSFSIAINSSFDDREGIIVFKDKNSTLSDTLTITQQAIGALFLEKEKFYIKKTGGTITYKVTSNRNYNISIPNSSDWITQITTKGLSSRDYSFAVSTNNSSSDRTGYIIFTSQDGLLKDTAVVKQTGFTGYYVYQEKGQSLSSIIPENDRAGIIRLKVEGFVNQEDFDLFKNGATALEYLDLSEASIQDNKIPDAAFKSDISLQTILFPPDLSAVGTESFYGCTNLRSLTLPRTIASIGNSAFQYCSSLSLVNCKIITPFTVNKAFSNISTTADLVVPPGTLNNYLKTAGWGYSFFKRVYEEGSDPDCFIKITDNSFRVTGVASSKVISVISSGDWNVSSKPDWITVAPPSHSKTKNIDTTAVILGIDQYSGNNPRSGVIEFNINGTSVTVQVSVQQYGFQYDDGYSETLKTATTGPGIDLVFLGDGYNFDEIVSGKYESDMRTALTHFLGIEPYRTYSDYFSAYTVFGFSQQSGISDIITTVDTKFQTRFTSAPPSTRVEANNTTCFNYAKKAPIKKMSNTVIVLVANTSRYGGTCYMWSSGEAISICPKSDKSYPYDFRGVVQHEASGHGFAKLADEYTSYSAMIPDANKQTLQQWQGYNFYLNVDLTNDLSKILWKHFIGIPAYSYVGAYEGGYYYTTGVWRPENRSLMINNIKYLNAPSRELVVKRIKLLAGESYSFQDFQAHDVMELDAATKAGESAADSRMLLSPPVLIKGAPKY